MREYLSIIDKVRKQFNETDFPELSIEDLSGLLIPDEMIERLIARGGRIACDQIKLLAKSNLEKQ